VLLNLTDIVKIVESYFILQVFSSLYR